MNHDERMAVLNSVGTGLVIRPGQQRRYYAYLEGVDVLTAGGFLHNCLSVQADTVEEAVERLYVLATGMVYGDGLVGICLQEGSGTRGRQVAWDPASGEWVPFDA